MRYQDSEEALAALLSERRHLLDIAYWLLGSSELAEEIVAEAYGRWYALDDAERCHVDHPRWWLARATGSICLAKLASPWADRQHDPGAWLPEPAPPAAPAVTVRVGSSDDRFAPDEAVDRELLGFLDSLVPAERAAFVLHEILDMSGAAVADVAGRPPEECVVLVCGRSPPGPRSGYGRDGGQGARCRRPGYRAGMRGPGRCDTDRTARDGCHGVLRWWWKDSRRSSPTAWRPHRRAQPARSGARDRRPRTVGQRKHRTGGALRWPDSRGHHLDVRARRACQVCVVMNPDTLRSWNRG